MTVADLDDTYDELALHAESRGQGSLPRESEREAADRRGWEALREFRAEAESATATATAAADLASRAEKRAARMERRWAWLLAAVGLLTATIGPVAIYATKKLLAGAEARGVAGERETTRLEDHAAIVDLRTGLAEVRGALSTISRLGAVRVSGPAPQPLLPGDPP